MLKRFAVFAVLMAVACWTAAALAIDTGEGVRQFNTSGQVIAGIKTADSTVVRIRATSDGSVQTAESQPFYDLTTERLLFNTASLTAGSADSCDAFDNHRNSLGVLALKITPNWAAHAVAYYAVQVRYHYLGSSDSMSVFPLYPINQAAGVASADSTGHLYSGSATTPQPSEFVVKLLKAQMTGAAYSYPWSVSVPLVPRYGVGVCPTYISIRVRNLIGPTAAVAAYYTSGP